MKFKKYIVVLLLSMIIMLSACGTQDIDVNDDTTIVENTEKVEDNTIKQNNEFDGIEILINRTYTLNPLISNDESLCEALGLVYQNIISYNEDNTISLNLIESYTFDSSNNSYEIAIKPNMIWDDGEPISADDFIYSYNTLLSAPVNAYYKPIISNVQTFTKSSNSTLKVSVKQAQTGNPYFLAFPIIPQHTSKINPMIDDVHLNTIVGNGLYSNVQNTVNNEIILRDNVTDNNDPIIDNIKLKIVNNEESIYYGFEQSVSNILNSTVANWSKFHVSKSVNINSYNNMEMTVLGFNFKTDINNDINFRNCIYYSIPFEQINSSIYLGYSDESRSIYPKTHFAYNPNIINEEFDAFKADEYLKKTAYGGQTLKLVTIADNNELEKVCEIIKANLAIIKVNVLIVPLSLEDYKKALINKDYDLYVGNYKMSVLPDYNKLFGKGNYSSYNNEVLVEHIEALNMSVNYDNYKNTANIIQAIIFAEKPVIPIVHNHDAIISDENFDTKKPQSYNTPYQNVDKWSITN